MGPLQYYLLLTMRMNSEGSGIVEAVGEGVTEFCVGDRVAYLASHSYAEYVTVSAGQYRLLCFIYNIKTF